MLIAARCHTRAMRICRPIVNDNGDRRGSFGSPVATIAEDGERVSVDKEIQGRGWTVFTSSALALAAAASGSIVPVEALNRKDWLNSENYLARSLAFEETGLVQADVYVDELGKPRACYVIVSSGSDLLDSQTCGAAMQKGKFVAAKAADGTPMPGIYRFKIQWLMEGSRVVPTPPDVSLSVARLPNGITSASVRLRYIVDEAGKIIQCEVDATSGVPSLDAAACRAMPSRFQFSPARDPNGVAHRVIRTQSVGFEVTK